LPPTVQSGDLSSRGLGEAFDRLYLV
jgi:hypothetical protein